MPELQVPLLIGAFSLGGAFIGSVASIAALVIQSRFQDRRERMRLAAQIAMEEYKFQADLISKNTGGGTLQGIATYIHYHIGLMALIEQGKLTPESHKQLMDKNGEMIKAIKDHGDVMRVFQRTGSH